MFLIFYNAGQFYKESEKYINILMSDYQSSIFLLKHGDFTVE